LGNGLEDVGPVTLLGRVAWTKRLPLLALHYTQNISKLPNHCKVGMLQIRTNTQPESLEIKKHQLCCEMPRNPAETHKTASPKLPKLLAFLQTDFQASIQQKDGEVLFPGRFRHGRLPWNQIFGDDLGFLSSMHEAYCEIQLHVGVHDSRIELVIAPNPGGFRTRQNL